MAGMAQRYGKQGLTVHRIDLSCEQAGFAPAPPFDVQVKLLPRTAPLRGWTLLAYAAAGKPAPLSGWLAQQPGVSDVRVEPGLAPRLLRATLAQPPPLWQAAASFVTVHHLDLAADGHASWFIAGEPGRVLAFVDDLERRRLTPLAATEVRCRPVHERRAAAPVSRRQFEALSTAVAMGYYDIPHRLDLRALAVQTGVSLGSLSELLRRAEAAVLTHYVDATLMAWPAYEAEVPNPFRDVGDLVRPVALAHDGTRSRRSRPSPVPREPDAWPSAGR